MSRMRISFSIWMFKESLKILSLLFRISGKLRKEIYDKETGYIFNARFQFKTRDNSVNIFALFDNGHMKAGFGVIDNPDVTLYYRDRETLARLSSMGPEETMDFMLTNDMSYTGNMAILMKFSYISTILKGARIKGYVPPEKRGEPEIIDIDQKAKRRKPVNERLDRMVDMVKALEDPYLADYSLDDFPRLQYLKKRRFAIKPALCVERARLITEFFRENGFENDSEGNPFDPELRQAMAVHHVMENKKPMILDHHLIAGSTTSREVGVPVYPEFIGTTIWPELRTISKRELNPYDISPEEADILNFEVFPFWMERTIREICRNKYDNPLSQQLEERWVLYFMMKNNAISHTVPDFKSVVEKGLEHTAERAGRMEQGAESKEKKNFYRSVQIVIDGVIKYASHLSEEALRIAGNLDPEIPEEKDRISELEEIARICGKVPSRPAETIHEAAMSIWICFTCLQLENANSALSIGRLDQILQPLFIKEIEAAADQIERQAIIKRTMELVGSLFLRFNDHDPMVPSVGNKLFGGTSSDDTVTVGGVDSQGNNAVCDMTYIILKVAEMLCFQDPNMNAKYHPGVNSEEYLRRLCEVNINMAASPIIQNDRAMIDALAYQGIPLEDARNWAATGCVEPTISGRHYGHTNCMLLNTVAPLEMALNNGIHPVMGDRIGPETGVPARDFPEYEDFLKAYKTQLLFLMEKSVEINNYQGETHQYAHPTPLLSALFTGPLEKGKDVINGGAIYNSSGVALVSLVDVIDSLLVIKRLVYEDKAVDFQTLIDALADNFEKSEYNELLNKISSVKKFGSGDEEAIAVAQDLMDFCYDYYISQENYRGGKYWVGYWSISYHVGFGMLSGALPSGRKLGKAFTPGLTPAPGTSDQLLPNLHAVGSLNNQKMTNNISFNVKLVPHPGDTHQKTLDTFSSYLKSYFEIGGMQWQCNVISSETMRDAMENPEDYRWLIVRISGYNAYFVKLNRNMQIELIERAEYQNGQ